jgi:ABC-type molybdate transport system substrate-binding protein
MIKGFIWSMLLILLTVSAASAQSQAIDVAAAKKEGKVVVYGSVVPQAMEELHKGFEKKYDIKVEYWRGSSTAVAERAQTEWRPAGPSSTWWSPAGTL